MDSCVSCTRTTPMSRRHFHKQAGCTRKGSSFARPQHRESRKRRTCRGINASTQGDGSPFTLVAAAGVLLPLRPAIASTSTATPASIGRWRGTTDARSMMMGSGPEAARRTNEALRHRHRLRDRFPRRLRAAESRLITRRCRGGRAHGATAARAPAVARPEAGARAARAAGADVGLRHYVACASAKQRGREGSTSLGVSRAWVIVRARTRARINAVGAPPILPGPARSAMHHTCTAYLKAPVRAQPGPASFRPVPEPARYLVLCIEIVFTFAKIYILLTFWKTIRPPPSAFSNGRSSWVQRQTTTVSMPSYCTHPYGVSSGGRGRIELG